jgi:hypothetical protein
MNKFSFDLLHHWVSKDETLLDPFSVIVLAMGSILPTERWRCKIGLAFADVSLSLLQRASRVSVSPLCNVH